MDSDRDEEKRREREEALRRRAELEPYESEPGKATRVGFEQTSGLVGGRSRVEEAFAALPWSRTSHATFDDFRATGLREVLARLGDRTLRRATVAAADREIAMRVAPTRPAASTAVGAAMWRAAERRAATLYRHAQDSGEVASDDPIVDEALSRCGSGQPLPASVRAQMERELGISLARVRVHTDAVAAAAAKAVRAHAFTVGEDIFFADGRYAPDSSEGKRLLAHELTHVVQAHQGRTSTGGGGVRVSEPGESLEREADAVAERVMQAPTRRPHEREMRRGSPSSRAKARYAPAPSHSLLLRKAHGRRARIADDTPFKDTSETRNKTAWRLRDDDVFVCVSGPDGKALDATITVSAERNPDRWNALGTTWAAAAPGRTWPRPAEGRSKAPRPSSGDSTHMEGPQHTNMDTDRAGPLSGTPMDVASAFEKVRSTVRNPALLGWLGLPADGKGLVYLDWDASLLHPADLHATISAPALELTRFSAGPLSAGKATLAGFVMKVNLTEASATFSAATIERAYVLADRKKIQIGKITLRGGKLGAAQGGMVGAGIHFDEAQITGIEYPGAPPADLVLTNSTLLAFADSFSALTATGGSSATLPTIPASRLLAGTRVIARLDGLGGTYNAGPSAKAMGGFSHFEAKLVRDGTPEPLASITIDGVGLSRTASTVEGSVKRAQVTGSADFVLALLDSPTVRAHKNVADVIDWMTKAGIVPTAGTQLTLENIQLGASGSTATARTDIVLDFDVPGMLKLHIELSGVAMSGDMTAQTGHVDFGKVFFVLSDRKGPIAALVAEGTADKGDKQLAGAIRHLQGTGDVSRITTALRSVKFPPKVAAVIDAVKKHVSTDGALDMDVTMTTGADGTEERRGNAHARLEVPGVGSVDLSVVNYADTKKKDLSGSLAFERFEAHLTPKPSANRKATGDAAALIITGAHAATASGKLPQHASADMIDLRGDLGKAAKMLDAIHQHVASLPPALQQAVKLVRTLDLRDAPSPAASSTPARESEPLPATAVTANAHVALVIPRLGTIDATVRGFIGSTQDRIVSGEFDTFEVSLLTTAGKRAARIVIRGGSGGFEADRKNDASRDVLDAQLADVVIEGNSHRLLDALEQHPDVIASAPTAIRSGFEYLGAHHQSLASTVNARATDLALARTENGINATAGTITARIPIPGGVATATMTKAEIYPGAAEFELLEVRVNDNAAYLRISNGQWTADSTGTAESIELGGDGPKLFAILEPNIIKLLPAEIGTAIRKYNDAIINATATDVSVRLTDDGGVAKLPFLDLHGAISFWDDGNQYNCQHASIRVYGAQVEGSADSQTITADRVRIEGRFEQRGGRTIRGNLVVNTGAAKLTHGAAGSGLVAQDILARGWLDVGAGAKAQESDHEIKDFDEMAETATNNAPVLRSLQLDFNAPLTPGIYGTGTSFVDEAMRVEVSPGAALHLHVSVDDGVVTQLTANIKGDVSMAFGTKLHRFSIENQQLATDVTGWFKPIFNWKADSKFKATEMKFDIEGFVAWAANQYRPHLVNDVKDKGGLNWADNDRIERDEAKADLEKRNAAWEADPNRQAANEPKTYGAIMKDLLNLHAITGTLDARIARPEAIGRKGADALSGDVQLHGSFVGGSLQLDADASVDTGNGTAKAKGLSSDAAISDGKSGGTMVTFHSFRVEELSWDPAARDSRK